MHPETNVTFDSDTFKRLKRSIKLRSETARSRKRNPSYATPVPEEIGLQLTYKCNLRCHHCFQWKADGGFFREYDKDKLAKDIPIEIIERIFADTHERKSNLYLWGGEPLVYKDWDRLSRLLERDPRWTVLCTNAHLIEKRLEGLLRFSEHLVVLISLDGYEDEHDAVRGKGSYEKVMGAIRLLRELQRKGEFKGKISINTVLNNENVGSLCKIMEQSERLGVDSQYFCFPWYISAERASAMDRFYTENAEFLGPLPATGRPSWHSYSYSVDEAKLPTLHGELKRLRDRSWDIRIRIQPALTEAQVDDYVRGADLRAQNRRQCLAISNRLDVLADGSVCACKCFPEFTMGDLHTTPMLDIWHSTNFQRFRGLLNQGLSPICASCILLYQNGI